MTKDLILKTKILPRAANVGSLVFFFTGSEEGQGHKYSKNNK